LNFGGDPVLLVELLQPRFDVAAIVGAKLLKQTKVLRSEFHKGFRHQIILKTLPVEKLRGSDRPVNGKEGLEIVRELTQRAQAQTPPGKARFSVGMNLRDTTTARRWSTRIRLARKSADRPGHPAEAEQPLATKRQSAVRPEPSGS
jgi:hypothetical protein